VAHTLDEALAIVRPFVDPLLDGSAAGRWDPAGGNLVPDWQIADTRGGGRAARQ
jgi:hypothetical protein